MKKTLFAGLGIAGFCAFILAVWIVLALSDLPDVSTLKSYRPAAASQVMDRDGAVMTEYFDRKFRIWVPIASLPDIVVRAVVTAEDDTFFAHTGVNYKATWDALKHDMQKRRFARGGSTITQQMIKNVLLSREKTVTRKLREYVLARKAEELLTKRQILQIYLNEVEWGDSIYGIEAASRFYFDKHAPELSAGEAALLAGMLPNPRYYNPYKRPDKAKKRQEQVLSNMLQAKLITQEEFDEARSTFLLRNEFTGRFSLPQLKAADTRPCYHFALEQILTGIFGEQNLYRQGMTIKTTLDRNLQNEMDLLEGKARDRQGEGQDEITIVLQNNQIRAMVCTPDREAELRERFVPPGFPVNEYDVATVPIESILREQIILSAEGEKKQAL
jgi:membrane peptidoglycan carboxypeptidase